MQYQNTKEKCSNAAIDINELRTKNVTILLTLRNYYIKIKHDKKMLQKKKNYTAFLKNEIRANLKRTNTNKRKLSLDNKHVAKMMNHWHTIDGLVLDSA